MATTSIPTLADLKQWISQRRSLLCVGLDLNIEILRANRWHADSFLQTVIALTKDRAIAYKVNPAFLESLGAEGCTLLFRLFREWLPDEHFLILDTKRVDVPHTMQVYARYVFDVLGAHGVTTLLFLGSGGWEPLLRRGWILPVLFPSSRDFYQFFQPVTAGNQRFTQWLAEQCKQLPVERVMPVIGATLPEYERTHIRQWLPAHWLLVPGIGAQGGTMDRIRPWIKDFNPTSATNPSPGGVLITLSRSVLYPKGQATTFQDIEEAVHRWADETASLLTTEPATEAAILENN